MNLVFMILVTLNLVMLECRNTKMERIIDELERRLGAQKRNNNRQIRNIRRNMTCELNKIKEAPKYVMNVDDVMRDKNTLEEFQPMSRKLSHSF